MSKTILADVDGFTPVIDAVMKDTSLMTAVIFGSIWRYCQMQNGVCQATLEKIAERTGVGRQTVIEHIQVLEKTGYIEDTTPDLRNRPHTYRDTGKAGLHIGVSTVRQVDSENSPTVRETDSTVRQTDSQSTPSVLEDSIKRGLKKEDINISSISSSKKVPESVEWMIAAGVSSGEIADLTAKERHSKEITDCYEKEMGYNNLPWGKLERLKKFLLAKTPEEIKQFAVWSKGKFSAFTPAKARLYPDMVIDLFPQAFLTEVKPPSMYDILAKQIEEERNGG